MGIDFFVHSAILFRLPFLKFHYVGDSLDWITIGTDLDPRIHTSDKRIRMRIRNIIYSAF